MAGSSCIYRLDTVGQNESTAPSSNKIEFNLGTVPDARGNVVSSNVHYVRDVSMHPNPKRSLNIIQDGGLGTKEVTVIGYFTDPVGAASGALVIFDNWMRNKATNASLPYGRFGLRLNDAAVHDFTPFASGGYILYDVYTERVEDSPNEVMFIAKLYLNNPTTPT
jgi:hypothetical protein